MFLTKESSTKILLLALFFSSFSHYLSSSALYEIDETIYVTDVIDGDSFYIQGDEVRLADVSCPEWDEVGGTEATEVLTDLIEGKLVYLDTDQRSGRDPYDRLVAVVYVDFNETHLLNVNAFMLVFGYAGLTDYTNNEFNPYTWTLFEQIDYSEEETPSETSDPYTELLQAYSELYSDYDTVINDYYTLVAEYNELHNDFKGLQAEHTQLETRYNELETSLNELENQLKSPMGIPGYPVFALIIGASYMLFRCRDKH